jgi:uncharacterized iron-regulated membrane protein
LEIIDELSHEGRNGSMFGFHAWDLLLLFIMGGIVLLIVSLVLWAVRRPTKVIIVPMNMQPPYPGQPYQQPGQPGAPPYPGPYQQPGQFPGQPPAQYPPQ